MTFVVALREARRWKRLWPLWSFQQGHRSSFVGLPNLGINPCVSRACCCCDLFYHICSCLFVFLSNSSLRFGLDLWSGDLPTSKEQPQHFTLPLGSGVVRYLSLKVYFSTCSEFHVGAGTPGCLRRNFRLSEVLAQTVGTFDCHWYLTLSLRRNF